VAWNAIVGVPLLLPSFVYVGVHLDHHRRTRYGTPLDPEYVPLAHHGKWRQAFFLVEALFVPLVLFLRFAVATPLSFLHPRLRRLVIERASSLSINPAFVRRLPAGRERVVWLVLDLACCAWALALAALVALDVLPLRSVLFGFAVATAVTVVNQLRTMGAHRFENASGAEMGIDEQLLDSVNVPGHPFLTELWAPVGLRYHGLHHYLPALPYHALGTAHRRLVAALPADAPYRRSVAPSLYSVLKRLVSRR
jgi:fatty acid desaturase